jgi:hypothetical protein
MSMGSLLSPYLVGALKISSWVKAVLLARSPESMAAATLADIAKVGGRCPSPGRLCA